MMNEQKLRDRLSSLAGEVPPQIAMPQGLVRRAHRRAAFVVTVGGHADLESTLVFLATGRVVEAGRVRQVRVDPYGQLVFLRTFQELLGDPRDHPVLEAMVVRRMARPDAPLGDEVR